jgi:hypothetical protein
LTNIKALAITGFSMAIVFIVGFSILFWINPRTLNEVNNLSLFVYNLVGMDGRMWAVIVIYLIIGVLNILFSIGLFILVDNKSIILAGKILLLISGILWLSFGLVPYETQTKPGGHLFLTRVIAIILTTSTSLIILGAEFEKIHRSTFSKWYTLSSGISILLLGFMSSFVFFDDTWIRTNASLTIYFLWFGVFGTTYLIQRKERR